MIDTKLISDWLIMKDKVKIREANLETLKQEAKDLAAKIHGMLAAEGCGKVNVNGVTVSPRRTMRARSAGMEGLCRALNEFGAGSMVKTTVNANTLTGFVNNYDPDRMMSADELMEKLPEELRDHLTLYEQLDLSISRSG